jgi:uncharacterized membrane protein
MVNISNTTTFVLAIHVLSFLSIGLNIPLLRQCVGFIYLTFIPGFVILGALNMTEKSITETLMLSVSLSVAFVMFIGLFINTLGPFLGVPEPLSANLSAVIMTSLTLIIFFFSQRKAIGKSLNLPNQDFIAELHTKGFIICVLSVLLLFFSAVGALYANTSLTILAIIGTAAIFATCTFSKVLPLKYYTFVLFVVSLGLLYQTSLLSRHIMGWDIFNEYYTFKLVRTAGYWSPPGVVHSFTMLANFYSMLSITILPTIYSTFLNVEGDSIFKVIYPFIFAFVPIFLYKTYESQSGKLVGLLSAFFFIANPINFYGLESLSIAREMIGCLFFSAAIFSLLNQDLSTRNKRVLVVIFSAGLAASAYSLSFIYVFFIVFVFIALRLRERGEKLLNLSLFITILVVIFAWYMFVSTPPLNDLSYVINNIFQRFTQDVSSSQARLDTQYALLSPTVQTTFVGLVHKILIYLTHGFIVVGAAIITVKPKTMRFSAEFRWMTISATYILIICLVVPNVAPALNFSRFYRVTMIFLSPLFVVGGIYVLDLLKRIQIPSRLRFGKVTFKGFELLTLVIVLTAFFLFRIGFANYVSGGYPISYSLNFDDMSARALDVSIPELDVSSARWLVARTENNSLVYADGNVLRPLIDYTNINRDNIVALSNTTQPRANSYIYLSSMNVDEGLYPIPIQSDKIYSNGQSETYFSP